MNILERQQYDELQERLATLSASLHLHWPAPAEARDEEAAITAYRKWIAGPPILVVAVACSLRLVPVLRQHGYEWILWKAETREQVAGDRVMGRLSVEVPNLSEGHYTLSVGLRLRGTEGHRRGGTTWKLPHRGLAAKSSREPQSLTQLHDVVAEFHSAPEDAAADGTRRVQLRRSPNGILTLWTQLTGVAGLGRLARFAIQGPQGDAVWQVSGFVGTDETGEGEINLRALDYRLETMLSPECVLLLEPVLPEDLKREDHLTLERSRNAAMRGREVLNAVLDGLRDEADA